MCNEIKENLFLLSRHELQLLRRRERDAVVERDKNVNGNCSSGQIERVERFQFRQDFLRERKKQHPERPPELHLCRGKIMKFIILKVSWKSLLQGKLSRSIKSTRTRNEMRCVIADHNLSSDGSRLSSSLRSLLSLRPEKIKLRAQWVNSV